MGHSNIIHADRIELPAGQRSYTIQLTPSIEMVPYAFVYVHYIRDGVLRYEEIKLTFPLEFENLVTLTSLNVVMLSKLVILLLGCSPGTQTSQARSRSHSGIESSAQVACRHTGR